MTRRSLVDAVGLRPAQRQLEAELGVTIAPVAVAMANALEERPDLAVISFDKVHEAYAGTYLAVATIYATLFDRSPEGLPHLSSASRRRTPRSSSGSPGRPSRRGGLGRVAE
jgi:hypothetical protein